MLDEQDKTWIAGQIDTQLRVLFEKIETKLLTEFQKSASPMLATQRSHSAALRALGERMELIEDRITRLETETAASKTRPACTEP